MAGVCEAAVAFPMGQGDHSESSAHGAGCPVLPAQDLSVHLATCLPRAGVANSQLLWGLCDSRDHTRALPHRGHLQPVARRSSLV
jgi:hypothetical protein